MMNNIYNYETITNETIHSGTYACVPLFPGLYDDLGNEIQRRVYGKSTEKTLLCVFYNVDRRQRS